MGVVVDKGDERIFHDMTKNDVCSFCGVKPSLPFMTWVPHGRGALPPVVVCGPCAKRIKAGFIADLVHLVAVVDLQEVEPGMVLTREHPKTVARRREESRKAMEKAMNGET